MNSAPVRTCIHVKANGVICGAIALRDSPRCYHHHSHRRRLKRAQLRADLGSPRGRLAAISQIVHAISTDRIDPKVARALISAISACGHLAPK